MQVYLSYAEADRDAADRLADRLKAEGFEVWSVDRDVFPGDNWGLLVGEALDRSEAMIILASPDMDQAGSVSRDLMFAIGAIQYKDRLAAIMVRKTNNYPWILSRINSFFDGTGALFEVACGHVIGKLQQSVSAGAAG